MGFKWFQSGRDEKSRRLASRPRRLALEGLEARELLSVNAADYELICQRYSDLNLAADFNAVNVIELEELSAASLQRAIDTACATQKNDLIVVDTNAFSSADLTIDSGITVNVDSGQYGSIALVSTGSDRLNIIANAGEEGVFTVTSGQLLFGGVNFYRAEADSTIYSLCQSLLVDAPQATWTTVDCAYFSNTGEDISERFTDQWAVDQTAARLRAAASASVSDSVSNTAADNYAVIFMGGYNQANNAIRYYQTLGEIYEILTTNFSLSVDNIYVLFGNGETEQQLAASGSYVECDLSFVSHLYKANETNLVSVMSEVAGKMDDSSHLLFYTYDHGGGKTNAPKDYNDYLLAWGGSIAGSVVADAVFQVKKGYVTCAFGQCYAGGVLDDIIDPATNKLVSGYDGTAHFAGVSATNHYEPSWTGTYDDGSLGGMIQEFDKALLSVEGVNTIGVFQQTVANDPFADSGQWERNKGTYQDSSVEHPWYAGESFSIFSVPDVSFAVALSISQPKTDDTISAVVTPSDATVTYQWYRGTSTESMTLIAGQTSSDYQVSAEDIGCYLKVVATDQGNYAGRSYSATTTEKVVPLTFTVTLSDGTPDVNDTISAVVTPSDATVTYQWYRGMSTESMTPIDDQTSSDYQVSVEDIGYYLKVVATGYGNYAGLSCSATTIGTVEPLKFTAELSTSRPRAGDTISAVVTPSDAMVTYRWYRGTSPGAMSLIDGQMSSSYQVSAEDIGYYLKVTVYGLENYDGCTYSVTTAEKVVPQTFTVTLSDENPGVNDTISAVITPRDAPVTYQWYRGTSPETMALIDGQTSYSYQAGAEDIGCYLKVVATGYGNYAGWSSSATTAEKVVPLTFTMDLSTSRPSAGDTVSAVVAPSDATIFYRWYRGTSTESMTLISGGQTSSGYQVRAEDIGYYLKVVATGQGKYAGSSYSVTTAEKVVPLTFTMDLSTSQPSAGDTISAVVAPSDATVTYQWYRGTSTEAMTLIDGQTLSGYQVSAEDIGYYLRVIATGYGNSAGCSYFATTTEKVVPQTFTVTLSDENPGVNDTISAVVTPIDAPVAYQWYRGTSTESMTLIAGQTSSGYQVSVDDIGYYLKVVATGQGNYAGWSYSATTTDRAVSYADDIYEPNDTPADATFLGSITEVTRVDDLIAGARQNQDWYKFTIENGCALDDSIVLTYTPTADHTLGLYLYDSAQRLIDSVESQAGTKTISLRGAEAGTYYVKVVNVHNAFDGADYALNINVHIPTFSVTETTTKSLTITVDPFAGAKKYVVEYSTDKNFSKSKTKSLTKAGSVTLSSLSADTAYYVRVKVSGSDISDSRSIVIKAATKAIPRLDCPALTVTSAEPKSLTISVGSVTGAKKYTVEYSTDAQFSSVRKKSLSKPGSVTIKSLSVDTTYYIRVKASASGKDFIDSSYTTIQTATIAYPQLDSPVLTATSATTKSLTISVGSVTGAKKYTVEYSTDAQFSSVKKKSLSKPGSVDLKSLRDDTVYYIRVKASGKDAKDSLYTVIEARTEEIPRLAAPTLALKARDEKSVTLTIGAVTGAKKYIVEYSTSPDFSSKKSKSTSRAGEVTIKLTAGQQYFFRVTATASGYRDSEYGQLAGANLVADINSAELNTADLNSFDLKSALLADGLTDPRSGEEALSAEIAAGGILFDNTPADAFAGSNRLWTPEVKGTSNTLLEERKDREAMELEICLNDLMTEFFFDIQ